MGPTPEDVARTLEQTYSAGGERALRRHAPVLQAQLDALPLDAHTQTATALARWVVAEPRLAREWLDALNRRYHWTTDFRATSALPEALALALGVRYEVATDPERHASLRIEAMLRAALRSGRTLLALFGFACLSELQRARVVTAAESGLPVDDSARERAMLPQLDRWAGYVRTCIWSCLLFAIGSIFGTQPDPFWRVLLAFGTVVSSGAAVLGAKLVGRYLAGFYARNDERARMLDGLGGHAVALLPLLISGVLRPVMARFQPTYLTTHVSGAFLMIGAFLCAHLYRDLSALVLPLVFVALTAFEPPLADMAPETRGLALTAWFLFSSMAILPQARARYAQLSLWKRRAGFGLIAVAAGLCMPALATHVGRRQGSTAALTACTAAIVAHLCLDVPAHWLCTWVGLSAWGIWLLGWVGPGLSLRLFAWRWPTPKP
jgi:hypothetical protein